METAKVSTGLSIDNISEKQSQEDLWTPAVVNSKFHNKTLPFPEMKDGEIEQNNNHFKIGADQPAINATQSCGWW